MNYRIIKRTIGWILLFESAFFLVPILTALIYGEKAVTDFLIAMLSCVAVGALMLIGKPKKNTIYAKEGFVIVALCWIALSLFGACAGSTGGGLKVSRIIVVSKGATHEVRRMIHPKQIKKITMDKRAVEHEVVRNINGFFIAYIGLFLLSLLLISLDGESMTTNFTAVTATINNIGPGLETVGPAGHYGNFSWWSKLVFIFDMLAGRLEIFPVLALLMPATWRK